MSQSNKPQVPMIPSPLNLEAGGTVTDWINPVQRTADHGKLDMLAPAAVSHGFAPKKKKSQRGTHLKKGGAHYKVGITARWGGEEVDVGKQKAAARDDALKPTINRPCLNPF